VYRRFCWLRLDTIVQLATLYLCTLKHSLLTGTPAPSRPTISTPSREHPCVSSSRVSRAVQSSAYQQPPLDPLLSPYAFAFPTRFPSALYSPSLLHHLRAGVILYRGCHQHIPPLLTLCQHLTHAIRLETTSALSPLSLSTTGTSHS
jgi:hypothetical protein